MPWPKLFSAESQLMGQALAGDRPDYRVYRAVRARNSAYQTLQARPGDGGMFFLSSILSVYFVSPSKYLR